MSGTGALDILALAHALIDSGWTQGAAVRRADGTISGILDPQATSYCLMGAIEAGRATITARTFSGPLYALLGSAAGGDGSLFASNDAPGRRKRDILRVIERAAARVGKS